MKKIYIKSLNNLISFNKNILNVKIENINVYKYLILNIYDDVIISVNDIEIDSKYLNVVYNPFDLDLNNPKLIKALYKKLNGLFDDYVNMEILHIEKSVIDIVEYLSIKIDSNIISEELDVQKLFSAISLKFNAETNNFYEQLLIYIKAYIDLTGLQFLITFRLVEFLSKEEFEELEYFLNSCGVVLLNFSFDNTFSDNYLIVDKDYCII